MVKMINNFVTAPLNFNALMTSGKKDAWAPALYYTVERLLYDF